LQGRKPGRDPVRRHVDLARQLGSYHANFFEFVGGNFARMDGWAALFYGIR
jgi:hypothetical protein